MPRGRPRLATHFSLPSDVLSLKDDSSPLGELTWAPRLPIPTSYSLSSDTTFPPKKSHARKRSATHIPRARNAFILFRCDFVRQQMVPKNVEKDHRNLSRIAGHIWKGLTDEQRAPWVGMADREKREHAERYGMRCRRVGDEKGASGRGRAKERKAVKPEEGPARTQRRVHEPPPHTALSYSLPGRRSSSCPPPGSTPITHGNAVPPSHMDLSFPPSLEFAPRKNSVMMFHAIHPPSSVFHTSETPWDVPPAPVKEAATWPWSDPTTNMRMGIRGPLDDSGSYMDMDRTMYLPYPETWGYVSEPVEEEVTFSNPFGGQSSSIGMTIPRYEMLPTSVSPLDGMGFGLGMGY